MARIIYRPEIDALRAVAIGSVFLYHLDASILPGGFVGVDIFFVISGYLITSIIFADLENSSFRFSAFYQRRIARIFPAFAVVTIFTLVAASLIYSSQDFASAGAVAIAAMLSLANIKLLFQGDYFDISPDAQPFLHYWSLSVEEQFYALFPAVLLVIYRIPGAHGNIRKIIGGLAFVSFILSIRLSDDHPAAAFYLLPTRAWELLSGAYVAVVHCLGARSRPQSMPVTWLMLVAGLLSIGVSVFTINENMAFPGYVALLPVAGASLLLHARHDYGASKAGRLIISGPLFYLGIISYSLYLWHWPAFSFVDYKFFDMPNATRIYCKIAASLILAVISCHLVEKPARAVLNKPGKRLPAFLVFGSITLVIVGAGFHIRTSNYVSAEDWQVRSGGITINGGKDKTCIILMGDSNASMYGKALRSLASISDVKASIISVDAGNPLPGSGLYENSVEAIKMARPDYLVFAASWTGVLDTADKQEELRFALQELGDYSDYIVLITQPPILPEQGKRNYIREFGPESVVEADGNRAARNSVNRYIRSLVTDRIFTVDIEDAFRTDDSEIRFLDDDGNFLYQDPGHLSGLGASFIINNYLSPMLAGHAAQYQTCLAGRLPDVP